jgi:hypothetical protein
MMKFRDVVYLVMQLRHFFKRKTGKAILIQRIFRGFSARLEYFRERLFIFMKKRATRQICAFLWQCKLTIERIKLESQQVRPLSMAWKRVLAVTKAFQVLRNYSAGVRARLAWEALRWTCALKIQPIMRGHIGRLKAKRLQCLRAAIRTWAEPEFAVEFVKNILKSKAYDYEGQVKEEEYKEALAILRGEHEETNKSDAIVRSFLPPVWKFAVSVNPKIFQPALQAYYDSREVLLLEAEAEALTSRFRVPNNGEIHVRKLDAYIALHETPCRIHGRLVCGTCLYLAECPIKNCRCKACKFDPWMPGLCGNCKHPNTVHKYRPLQCKDHEDDMVSDRHLFPRIHGCTNLSSPSHCFH